MKNSNVQALGRLGCALVLTALHAIAGCDAQAPEDYRGEPLLSITGKVELALEREDRAGLQPALVFVHDEVFSIMEVEVSGEFPGNSRSMSTSLRLTTGSIRAARVPRVAALIGAVPEDHPDEVYVGPASEITEDVCLADTGDCLLQTEEWCTPIAVVTAERPSAHTTGHPMRSAPSRTREMLR